MSENKRLNYIDVARGIALFFVIAGHLFKFDSIYFNLIFGFHMPLFFIISGICFELKPQKNFKKFIKNKFFKIIVPYICFVIFGFIVCLCIKTWRADLFSILTIKQIFYYTQPEILHVGQTWFLVVLFLSSIMTYLVNRFFIEPSNTNIEKNIKQMVFILLFTYVAFSLPSIIKVPYFEKLPFKFDIAFMATSFMMVGSLIERNKVVNVIFKKRIFAPIVLLVFAACNIFFGLHLNGYVNLCVPVYKNILYYMIAAVTGSLVILIISYTIKNNKILEYYGKNSLFMFCIHSMFLYISEVVLTKSLGYKCFIMTNIPARYCIITAISIYILLYPTTMIYNKIKSLFKGRKSV